MDRLKALAMYYGYKTLVMRDSSIHPLNIADLAHADDSDWDVRLILYPLPDPFLCPGTLEEAAGYFEGLKTGHYDFLNLIEQGYAISVDSLEEDPYCSTP